MSTLRNPYPLPSRCDVYDGNSGVIGNRRLHNIECRIWPDLRALRRPNTTDDVILWTHILITPAQYFLIDGRAPPNPPLVPQLGSDWVAMLNTAPNFYRVVLTTRIWRGESAEQVRTHLLKWQFQTE